MKKLAHLIALASCMEQVANEVFRPLAEQQQQAQSLPIVPGDASPVTLAVATAIKPTETPGSLVEALLTNKGTADDRKVAVFVAVGSALPVVAMLPATAMEADFLNLGAAGAGLAGTVTRDDATKVTSSHTLAVEAGKEADALNVALALDLAASKPKRGVAALVNAIFDDIPVDAMTKLPTGNYAIVFDQTGNGAVKLYNAATQGDLSEAVAKVNTEAAPAATTAPSLW